MLILDMKGIILHLKNAICLIIYYVDGFGSIRHCKCKHARATDARSSTMQMFVKCSRKIYDLFISNNTCRADDKCIQIEHADM